MHIRSYIYIYMFIVCIQNILDIRYVLLHTYLYMQIQIHMFRHMCNKWKGLRRPSCEYALGCAILRKGHHQCTQQSKQYEKQQRRQYIHIGFAPAVACICSVVNQPETHTHTTTTTKYKLLLLLSFVV